MNRGNIVVSKMAKGMRPEKPTSAKNQSGESRSRTTIQYGMNNSRKGNMIVLESSDAKSSKQTLLPSIKMGPHVTQKDYSFTQRAVLPPASKGQQTYLLGKWPHKHTVLSPNCKPPQISSHQHAIKIYPFRSAAMSPEAVMRYCKPYLTKYELQEILEYKHVWYLGKKANKIYNKDMKSFNSGFDNTKGFYIANINDHLAYRFQILKVLGTGFSGQVLKCMDHKSMKLVAIKVIRNTDSAHQLGKAEVNILKVLRQSDKDNTANIVHMKENFYFRNHLCITFELLEKDLQKALNENKIGFDEKELKKYAKDVLKCLKLLKNKRIIHSDLKPDNTLLYRKDGEMHAAVTDFGGSYFVEERDQPFIQTLYYKSPEMLLGNNCSSAIDMWSLGCMLAELHLGHRLFRGSDDISQFSCIMKVLSAPPLELLTNAPKRHSFFDPNGIPLDSRYASINCTTLASKLKSTNSHFVDFIERCLLYDPTKRLTPEEALQHPWIHKAGTKVVMSAATSVPSSIKKPALLKREKVLPLQLQPNKNIMQKRVELKRHTKV